jgi:hypothetical protein
MMICVEADDWQLSDSWQQRFPETGITDQQRLNQKIYLLIFRRVRDNKPENAAVLIGNGGWA